MKTKNKPFRLIVRENYELSGFENIINVISNLKEKNQLCYAYYLKNKAHLIKSHCELFTSVNLEVDEKKLKAAIFDHDLSTIFVEIMDNYLENAHEKESHEIVISLFGDKEDYGHSSNIRIMPISINSKTDLNISLWVDYQDKEELYTEVSFSVQPVANARLLIREKAYTEECLDNNYNHLCLSRNTSIKLEKVDKNYLKDIISKIIIDSDNIYIIDSHMLTTHTDLETEKKLYVEQILSDKKWSSFNMFKNYFSADKESINQQYIKYFYYFPHLYLNALVKDIYNITRNDENIPLMAFRNTALTYCELQYNNDNYTNWNHAYYIQVKSEKNEFVVTLFCDKEDIFTSPVSLGQHIPYLIISAIETDLRKKAKQTYIQEDTFQLISNLLYKSEYLVPTANPIILKNLPIDCLTLKEINDSLLPICIQYEGHEKILMNRITNYVVGMIKLSPLRNTIFFFEEGFNEINEFIIECDKIKIQKVINNKLNKTSRNSRI